VLDIASACPASIKQILDVSRGGFGTGKRVPETEQHRLANGISEREEFVT
jgi:hypothetical protein